jgi:pilus assembly protein CpaE
MPKRPEIKPADFAKALDDEPVAVIPFEPQIFGTAANNGQMIAEVSANNKINDIYRAVGLHVTGRQAVQSAGRGSSLSSLFKKRA